MIRLKMQLMKQQKAMIRLLAKVKKDPAKPKMKLKAKKDPAKVKKDLAKPKKKLNSSSQENF